MTTEDLESFDSLFVIIPHNSLYFRELMATTPSK